MNIRELKRRLMPYSGYMKPAEEGDAAAGGAAEEALDLGNDLPEDGAPQAPAPSAAAAPAPAPAAASDAAGGGADDADEPGKPGGGIPRVRFNEVNDRRKALESENEELRAQLAASARGGAAPAPAQAAPQTAAVDVDALEEQYTQALLDGDSKAAVALRKQINLHIEEAVVQRFEQATQHSQSVAKSQEVTADALATYPWLNEPEGAEALELIDASVRAKLAGGVPHHVALAQAIATIAPRFAPDGPPSRVLPGKADPVDTRLKTADERGAAHSLLQPAAVQAGMGNRATAPKIDESTKLSDEQIEGLSKAELEKSLGIA
ncbi:hypothetical protein [Acidovorax sp. LjRoot117]|uniref:hypothetical protein n=1 Tax=Acidovorax sp. LjRoot117 TaxID=3342255 RepID=UPI003ECD52BB